MTLVPQHPKRTFMRRAVEFEIRLSYHDRIMRILPEPMREADANVISVEAPGPDYIYDDPSKSYPHDPQGPFSDVPQPTHTTSLPRRSSPSSGAARSPTMSWRTSRRSAIA